MPDIDFQKIVLNLIPKPGNEPVVFYASQFETARPFIADLMWGESEFTPGDSCWAEIDIRKVDDNLVVITDDVTIDNNEVSVVLPIQAVTCVGKNFGQVKIYAAEDTLVCALNFILEVQPDPLAGGVTSETAIDNLASQIEEIAQEEGFLKADDVAPVALSGSYNDLTDKPTIPDMSNYYTKSETYSKTQVDDALALKANTADLATVATTGDYDDLINKPDLTNYYTKAQVDTIVDNMLPTISDSGTIVNFSTALERPLINLTVEPSATKVTRCSINIFDNDISNVTEGSSIITISGDTIINNSNIAYDAVRYEVKIAAGSYCFHCDTLTTNGIIQFDYDDNGSWTNINFLTPNQLMFTGTIPDTTRLRISLYSSDTSGLTVTELMYEYGTSQNAYELYNGNDYAVADIGNITTLEGVNNIYADAGSINVSAKDTIQHYIDERT